MKTRISALMDGELEDHEIADTLRDLRREGSLHREWHDYHLVGAALRGESPLATDLTSRVMEALEAEPTVMAPARRSVEWRRPALALAASAAGVAVVAWLGLGSLAPDGRDARLALQQPAALAVAAAPATPRLQEYLIAHQAHAPGGAITGGARHNIRTVAMAGQGR